MLGFLCCSSIYYGRLLGVEHAGVDGLVHLELRFNGAFEVLVVVSRGDVVAVVVRRVLDRADVAV